jgi:hypothetical protein
MAPRLLSRSPSPPPLSFDPATLAAGDCSQVRPTVRSHPFALCARRAASGFYVTIALADDVGDEEEAAFRALIFSWLATVRTLPARDGRGVGSVTARPSFERGARMLGVAGHRIDVARAEAAGELLDALARFHREIAALTEVGTELP